MKKSMVLFLILALLISSIVLADNKNGNDEIAAVVNGEEITKTEVDQAANVEQLISQLRETNSDFVNVLESTEAGNDFLNEYRKEIIDEVIEQKLVIMEAEENVTVSQKEKDALFNNYISQIIQRNNMTEEQLTNELKNQGHESLEAFKGTFLENNKNYLLVNKLQEQKLEDVTIEDKKVKEHFEENKNQYKQEEQVKASHILINTEERSDEEAKAKAQEIIDKLNEGAKFADLAKEYSDGPTGENGGSLGYVAKGKMVPEFEEAAFAMEEDEISEPVKTQYGYHVIKVEGRKEEKASSYDEAKDQISETLRQQEMEKVWVEFVKELKENAEIDIKL